MTKRRVRNKRLAPKAYKARTAAKRATLAKRPHDPFEGSVMRGLLNPNSPTADVE